MIRPFFLAVVVVLTPPTQAHDWYTGTSDPKTGFGCCGGADCNEVPQAFIDNGAIAPSADGGFDVALTVDQTHAFNLSNTVPIAIHIQPERVQPAEASTKGGSGYSLCIWGDTIKCFFAPLGY